MITKSKPFLRQVPSWLMAFSLAVGAGLKLSGHHPLMNHFIELGLGGFVPWFGIMEALFALLFVLRRSAKIGLLLLTAYFGGAMAVELPHGMVTGPAVVLVLVWTAAFIRNPSYFKTNRPAEQHFNFI